MRSITEVLGKTRQRALSLMVELNLPDTHQQTNANQDTLNIVQRKKTPLKREAHSTQGLKEEQWLKTSDIVWSLRDHCQGLTTPTVFYLFVINSIHY